MSARWEVAVVGLGALGAATIQHLARRGIDSVGLDRFHPPHARSSHGGNVRLIRRAIFEHPDYVPWVERAYELWEELEEATGRAVLQTPGGLHVGTPEGTQVPGARRALERHGLAFEQLDRSQLESQAPWLCPAEEHEAIREPKAGFVSVEPAIRGMLERAQGQGARLELGRRVTGLHRRRDGWQVRHEEGEPIQTDELVLAAGPWLGDLLPEIALGLEVERQVPFVLDPRHAELRRGQPIPVFTFEPSPGRVFYGIQRPDGLVKVAIHHEGEIVDPERVDRVVRAEDEARLRRLLERFAPGLDGTLVDASVCLYTNTPDGHPIVAEHPREDGLWLVGGASGHAFKHAPAIGEAAAQLVDRGQSELDRSLFELQGRR